ncbi:MAG: preprotein translocase subunit YajC [Bacteroidales bacterium]|nr:preprotein translocase subunit YajC [Bacteroidales bacterium]
MNYLFLFLQEEAGRPASGGMMMWVIIIVCIVIMWFFMIRPQRKQQKELQQFRDGLKRGDKIVTVGGIFGVVVEVKENTLLIEISDDVKIKVSKNSVVRDPSETQQQ